MRLLLSALILAAATTFGSSASAVTLQTGLDSTFGNESAAIRFRSFQPTGGEEIYVGTPDLGVASNRLIADEFNWASGGTAFNFSFGLDANTDTLSYSLTGDNVAIANSATFAQQPNINAFKLSISDRDRTGDVFLTNLVVNGTSLGDVSDSNLNAFQDYTISGVDFSSGIFSITGTINRIGPFTNSQESARIELVAGTVDPIPLPAAGWLLLAGVGGLAAAARRKKAKAA